MTTVMDEVRAELHLEHQQVCDPLLRRIMKAGEEIEEGAEYPIGYLREGLGLWKRYLTELRDRGAEEIALPLLAGSSLAHGDPRLFALQSEQPREREQVARLERLIDEYRENPARAHWRLGSDLRNYALVNRAWRDEEVRFVSDFLPPRVDENLARTVRAALDRLKATAAQLAGEVRSYVAGPVPARAPSSAPP